MVPGYPAVRYRELGCGLQKEGSTETPARVRLSRLHLGQDADLALNCVSLSLFVEVGVNGKRLPESSERGPQPLR